MIRSQKLSNYSVRLATRAWVSLPGALGCWTDTASGDVWTCQSQRPLLRRRFLWVSWGWEKPGSRRTEILLCCLQPAAHRPRTHAFWRNRTRCRESVNLWRLKGRSGSLDLAVGVVHTFPDPFKTTPCNSPLVNDSKAPRFRDSLAWVAHLLFILKATKF